MSEESQACPYCGSADNCEHLLLLVDQELRSAVGGVLMEEFNEHWSNIQSDSEANADEHVQFSELLEEIDSLANKSLEYRLEEGSGISSPYIGFYSASKEYADNARYKFEVLNLDIDEEDEEDEEDEGDGLSGDRCPICNKFNEPGALEVCDHHVGWFWDNMYLDLNKELEDIKEAWNCACGLVEEKGKKNSMECFLRSDIKQALSYKELFELTNYDAVFLDFIEQTLSIQQGGGWATSGMLGGSGFNLYNNNKDGFHLVLKWCQTLNEELSKLPDN